MATRTVRVRHARKLAATQVIPFSRQIASMLGAGMSVLASIMTLEEQCDNPDFKKVLQHLLEVIERGEVEGAGASGRHGVAEGGGNEEGARGHHVP